MSNGNGVSRGDRNRNARLSRLRVLVPACNAIVGIDLADNKQMVVVADHDSKVLARRTFRFRAWDLGLALDWAGHQASKAGFAGVTVACEPTGHRWRVLGQLAADRGMAFVWVQTLLTSWARRSEDLTFDKTDEKDAVLIARLTAQLRCYIPEPLDERWGRLRHLGARRERLLAETVGQVQQIRDLLECVWPASLDTAKQPFRSRTWLAGMSVVLARTDGDPARLRRLGPARFEAAVRREVVARQGKRPCLLIVRLLFVAAADPRGVTIHRPGDLTRFASARAVVKHSGLAPWEKSSGTYTGRTKLTGQGRPGLRTAAWRAIWGAQKANPVYVAKFTHLTSRTENKLNRGQAHAALAAALLRQLYAVVTTGQKWDAAIAAGGRREVIEPAA
jgi:transposase